MDCRIAPFNPVAAWYLSKYRSQGILNQSDFLSFFSQSSNAFGKVANCLPGISRRTTIPASDSSSPSA